MLGIINLNDTREHEDHVAALVHDGRVAVRAADLAGQPVVRLLVLRVIEREALGPPREVQVLLMEDGGPLERRSCSRQVRYGAPFS